MRTLQELRKAKGLTAFQLDEAAGIGKGFTTRLECGIVSPQNVTIGNAHKISVILGISLDEFYMIVTNIEPNHKKGSPLMITGQPRQIGGDSWKYRRKKNDQETD